MAVVSSHHLNPNPAVMIRVLLFRGQLHLSSRLILPSLSNLAPITSNHLPTNQPAITTTSPNLTQLEIKLCKSPTSLERLFTLQLGPTILQAFSETANHHLVRNHRPSHLPCKERNQAPFNVCLGGRKSIRRHSGSRSSSTTFLFISIFFWMISYYQASVYKIWLIMCLFGQP